MGTSFILGDGDLCTMEGLCQKHYQHRVPKQIEAQGPRINLTWRWLVRHHKTCPMGMTAGPLREKMQKLAEARCQLERLQRRKERQQAAKEATAPHMDSSAQRSAAPRLIRPKKLEPSIPASQTTTLVEKC